MYTKIQALLNEVVRIERNKLIIVLHFVFNGNPQTSLVQHKYTY